MMRLPLLFIFLTFALNAISAQPTVQRVTYQASHEFPASDVYNGMNTLYFNQTTSRYLHNNYPSKSSVKEDQNIIRIKAGDPEQFPVYVSLRDSVIMGKVRGLPSLANQVSIIEEPLQPVDWKIGEVQRIIGGYPAIQATATVEGRTYVAWFTPAIPVPFGPYRLYGLPGLILEASTEDGQVKWTFESIGQVTDTGDLLTPPTYGEHYDWEEFVEARIATKLRKESKSGVDFSISVNDPNPDFFIERDKFSIFKHYLND